MRSFLILPADIDTDPVFRKRGADQLGPNPRLSKPQSQSNVP
jgi:hypothetical protein